MPSAIKQSQDLPLAWVTGAGGLVGHELVVSAGQYLPGWRVRGLTRAEVDLLDRDALEALFRREQPAALVHCAATSRSPVCEKDPVLARRNNVDATNNLLQIAPDIPFLFFSTDLVFDGKKGNYVEEDPPNPLSVYAETKVAAEVLVRRHQHHLILRISLVLGRSPAGDRAFNEEMVQAWSQGRTLNLFTDEFRCPLPVQPIARTVWELIQKNARGTYHLNGSEKLSRFEIGRLLADRHPELHPKIRPGSRKDYQGPPRPADTSLNISKIQQILSFSVPGLSDWLRRNPEAPI